MQQMLSRFDSIDKMYRIGLNVPEILLNLPRPKDTLEYQKYHTILDEVYKHIRNNGIRTVFLDNEINIVETLGHAALKEAIVGSEYGKEGILLLKAPRTDAAYKGYVIPGPHYFTAMVDDSEPKKFVWGMHNTFTIRYLNLLRQLNDTLSNRRLDLDGSCVEFTYHPSGEGVLSDNLLFWGFKNLKYNGDE